MFTRLATLTSALIAVASASADIALDVRDFAFPSDSPAPHAFIRFRGGEVLLPVNASNYQLVSETARLAAVSYHVTSDYDSVAVVAEIGDSLLMLPDIWRELEDTARAQHIIPDAAFDHTYIRAVRMHGGTLECTFSAHGAGTEFACKFLVDVVATKDKLHVHIRSDKGT
jgi:hypothetical protein